MENVFLSAVLITSQTRMHIDYSPGEKNRTKPGQDRQIQKQQEKKEVAARV